MDEVIRRQGEFIENDLVDLDPGDFASGGIARICLLYTSPSPRDGLLSRMPSSA